MDPLHFVIAVGPLATYLLLLGIINLSSRPFVTTGGRDAAALAVGISGFVVAGPMELFLPEGPTRQFGGFVWLLLLTLYALSVTLLVLLLRPRLVIYNIAPQQLQSVLGGLVEQLDSQARWAGQCLVLPQLGVQLHVETFAPMRSAELISAGPQQSLNGWRRLESALIAALRETPGSRNPYGAFLTVLGVAALSTIGYWVISHHQVVAHSLREMLRL